MTEELKPCPFCGGKAEYDNDTGPLDEGFWEWYQCQNCGAKQDSITEWNTRIPLPLPPESEAVEVIVAAFTGSLGMSLNDAAKAAYAALRKIAEGEL